MAKTPKNKLEVAKFVDDVVNETKNLKKKVSESRPKIKKPKK